MHFIDQGLQYGVSVPMVKMLTESCNNQSIVKILVDGSPDRSAGLRTARSTLTRRVTSVTCTRIGKMIERTNQVWCDPNPSRGSTFLSKMLRCV